MSGKLDDAILRGAGTLRKFGAREVYVFGPTVEAALDGDSDISFAVVGLPPESFYRAASGTMTETGLSLHLVDLDEDTPLVRFLREEGELRRVP